MAASAVNRKCLAVQVMRKSLSLEGPQKRLRLLSCLNRKLLFLIEWRDNRLQAYPPRKQMSRSRGRRIVIIFYIRVSNKIRFIVLEAHIEPGGSLARQDDLSVQTI